MKRICEALDVSRSRGAECKAGPVRPRPTRYSKVEDEALLPLIRQIVDARLTYGYRRVCAILNRRQEEAGHPRVNHKRVYRIMLQRGLLLARHTGKRPERPYKGKVITLRSNLRWSADTFEIACQSGETVRVAFAIDCCDREAIGMWPQTGGGPVLRP